MAQISYSDKYFDDTYEYRHVVLPREIAKILPKNRLLSENEWRSIGVQQSRGWIHYAIHRPEPHIMLFRRPLNYQQQQQQQPNIPHPIIVRQQQQQQPNQFPQPIPHPIVNQHYQQQQQQPNIPHPIVRQQQQQQQP